ncbi:50S ribosomal protein P1 [Candidatus Woesearchaeota archaeon]|nr:50S ribosomal protein P1 [Candidatus Woesearchaeota archaeon]
MEYIYAAMLLYKAGKKIDEASVKKVLEAAGAAPDDARVKALVAALEGVDIGDVISKAAIAAPVAAAPAAAGAAPAGEEKKDEKKEEDEKKSEEQAAAGLGSLFG